jgi:hypothetical protein
MSEATDRPTRTEKPQISKQNFSFERICDALDKLSYLVMAISVLLSVNIILRK